MELIEIGKAAKAAEQTIRNLSTVKKNEVLLQAADHLIEDMDALLAANELDMEN